MPLPWVGGHSWGRWQGGPADGQEDRAVPRKAKFPPPRYVKKSRNREIARVHDQGKAIDVYLGVPGSPEADAAYKRLVAELVARDGHYVPPAAGHTLTVHELVARFLVEAERKYARSGREYENFERSLSPLTALYGSTPARDFGPKRLRALQVAMATGSWMTQEERDRLTRRGAPYRWCVGVVNRRINRIRTMFGWAVREELLPGNQIHALREVEALNRTDAFARSTPEVEPAREEEVNRVVAEAPPAVAAILRLMWQTGMRPGEGRLLRPVNLDTEGIEIDGQRCWLYFPGKHKNDWRTGRRMEAIVLPPASQELLRPWLDKATDPEDCLLRPRGRRSRCGHYTSVTFAQAVRRAAERAGLADWHAYRARHGVKLRAEAVIGPGGARALLRHRSLQTTARYAKGQDLELAARAALAIAAQPSCKPARGARESGPGDGGKGKRTRLPKPA